MIRDLSYKWSTDEMRPVIACSSKKIALNRQRIGSERERIFCADPSSLCLITEHLKSYGTGSSFPTLMMWPVSRIFNCLQNTWPISNGSWTMLWSPNEKYFKAALFHLLPLLHHHQALYSIENNGIVFGNWMNRWPCRDMFMGQSSWSVTARMAKSRSMYFERGGWSLPSSCAAHHPGIHRVTIPPSLLLCHRFLSIQLVTAACFHTFCLWRFIYGAAGLAHRLSASPSSNFCPFKRFPRTATLCLFEIFPKMC